MNELHALRAMSQIKLYALNYFPTGEMHVLACMKCPKEKGVKIRPLELWGLRSFAERTVFWLV